MPTFRRIARLNPCFAETAHWERPVFEKNHPIEQQLDPIQQLNAARFAFNLLIPGTRAGFFCPPVLDHHENYSLY